jgi:plastocyanin
VLKSRVHPSSILAIAILLEIAPAIAAGPAVTGRASVPNPSGAQKAVDNSNVVVWLAPIAGTADHLPAPRPERQRFRLLQKHKRFEPHLLVLPLGSAVEFPNLDPFFHNVFSLFEGKRFDLGLYEAGTTRTMRFDRPGICYIFCNIHPEMSAIVFVMATPYYGVSNRAGDITIPDVPPGRYQLQVWHERSLPEALKTLSREITISEDSSSLGIIRLSESGMLMVTHKNKYGRDYDTPTPASPLYEQP